MRSDAVSLEVPVRVHGSRATEVAREATPHTEPFEEQTSTMIVFPQGAVIRMSTSVNVGQMLVVTNVKSRQDAICRVVKVRTFSNLQGYVEVEFTHKQPGYWSIYFPSEGPAIASKAAQPTVVEPPVPAIKKTIVPAPSDISWAPSANAIAEKPVEANAFPPAIKPAIAPPQNVSPAKPEPSFVSIGQQEQVQPAASTITPAPVVEAPSTVSLPDLHETVQAVTSTPEFPFGSGESSEPSQFTSSTSDESVPSTFGSLSGGAILGTRAASSGDAPDSYAEASAHSKSSSGQNWILIAACLTLLFAAVGAGVFYFRSNSTSAKSNPPALAQPAADEPVAVAANLNTPPTEGSAAPPQVSNPGHAVIANTPPSTIVSGNASAETHDSSVSSNRPSISAKPDVPHITSDMMSRTLKSHPVSSQRTGGGQDDAAPSLDAAAPASSTTGALPGFVGASDIALPPAPDMKQEGPVKIGGLVKEPRLLSSTLPVYPAFAKSAHVEGDVVIRTSIDKNGNVSHMEVVSGPTMLRQAALDALARWKYEPSKLDGQPVPVQMLVTIRFHR
jgi:TonB family protein